MNTNLPLHFIKASIRYILTGILFLVFGLSVYCQAKFTAVPSSTTIGYGDYLQVQLMVENAAHVESITPPPFRNFNIVSGPNQESGMSTINGVTKQYISLSFVLKPLKKGKINIESATAVADGKEFHSSPVTIVVNNSSAGNSGGTNSVSPFGGLQLDFPPEPVTQEYDDYIIHKGENVPNKIKKNLFIKVYADKTTCYVGEPITATYKLYTRLKSESSLTKSPSFNGFSVTDLDDPGNAMVRKEKLNGREYNVYILRKVQLYPLQPGTVPLEPAEVENKVTFISEGSAHASSADAFDNLLNNLASPGVPGDDMHQETVTLKSTPVNINVLPLPENGKPVTFKGAVGHYTITADIEKDQLTTNDAGKLNIHIKGNGNIQLINAPEILWPEGIDGFEAKTKEDIDKSSVPLSGEKTFTYPFTISKPGNYAIPGVTFSYFDVTEKKYKTITTPPQALTVVQGKINEGSTPGSNTRLTIPTPSFGEVIFNNGWILILIGGFLFITALFVWNKNVSAKQKLATGNIPIQPTPVQKDNIETPPVLEEVNAPAPSHPLTEAAEKLISNDTSGFYSSLQHCLLKYLSVKLNIPFEDLTRKRINEKLDRTNAGITTTLMLGSVLDEIERNLYSPIHSNIQMNEIYEKANETVGLLEKQIIL